MTLPNPIPLNLDNAATTPIDPEVLAAMRETWLNVAGNPASQHTLGRQARHFLDEARDGVARLLGARVDRFDADRLVLTSGGTEANNLALRGLAGRPPGRIIVSSIEHPSIAQLVTPLSAAGFTVERLAVDRNGQIDLNDAERHIVSGTRLVSVMLGNNETGVLQPVPVIARLCRERGVLFHTDAVQAVGKLPVDFHQLGVDALTVTPHKFHGPLGIGGLLVRAGLALEPSLFGGSQQLGLRPGTESVALTVGFHRALQQATVELAERSLRIASLRQKLETTLLENCPEVTIQGAAVARLPHVSNVAFPGLDRQSLLMALDMAGVACSTGSTCASGSSEPSPVLQAMGLDDAIVRSALRFSLSARTTDDEITQALERIVNTCNDLRRQSTARKYAAPPRAKRSDSL